MAGQSCFRWVPAMKRGLLCTGLDLVSRRCQTGAVVDVDFKLYCSLKDSKRVQRKVESSSSEAKIVRFAAERRKIFPSWPEKGTSGLSFFALEGKIKQGIRISAR